MAWTLSMQREPNDEGRPRRQRDGDLVVHAHRLVELAVQCEAAKLPHREKVRDLERPAVPGSPVVRDERVLRNMPLKDAQASPG
jgi:hypothetical protein